VQTIGEECEVSTRIMSCTLDSSIKNIKGSSIGTQVDEIEDGELCKLIEIEKKLIESEYNRRLESEVNKKCIQIKQSIKKEYIEVIEEQHKQNIIKVKQDMEIEFREKLNEEIKAVKEQYETIINNERTSFEEYKESELLKLKELEAQLREEKDKEESHSATLLVYFT